MALDIKDPIYLEHLRDLPSGYLLDLLSDDNDLDAESLYWVLQERGLSREEIAQKVQRRSSMPWVRPYKTWSLARWISLCNVLIIAYFNITGLYHLLQGEHAFRGILIFLSVGCILCGFYIGFKLSTHLYQGSKTMLFCGFPIPVGKVDLKSGEEILSDKKMMMVSMASNAIVGVNLALFPLIFMYIMMI